MTNNETLLPCREAFEKWCLENGAICAHLQQYCGIYTNDGVHNQWKAWQAALSESVLDRVVEALEKADKLYDYQDVQEYIQQALSEIQALRGK